MTGRTPATMQRRLAFVSRPASEGLSSLTPGSRPSARWNYVSRIKAGAPSFSCKPCTLACAPSAPRNSGRRWGPGLPFGLARRILQQPPSGPGLHLPSRQIHRMPQLRWHKLISSYFLLPDKASSSRDGEAYGFRKSHPDRTSHCRSMHFRTIHCSATKRQEAARSTLQPGAGRIRIRSNFAQHSLGWAGLVSAVSLILPLSDLRADLNFRYGAI